MDGPRIDSRSWTSEVGEPAPLPYDLDRRKARPLRTGAQNRALPHAVLLILSPLLLFLADWLLRTSIRDLSVGTPAFLGPAAIVALAGAGLLVLARRNVLTLWCRRLALAGWISMILAAFAYVAAGAYAHQVAVAGPMVRAQIVAQHAHGRGLSRSNATTFAFQDGATAETGDYQGGARRCFAVRRLQGPNGFAWLRIADASPEPGPGQLDWPIDRATCFSATPLAAIGH